MRSIICASAVVVRGRGRRAGTPGRRGVDSEAAADVPERRAVGDSWASPRTSWTYWWAISCFRTSTTTPQPRDRTNDRESSKVVRVTRSHCPRRDSWVTSSRAGCWSASLKYERFRCLYSAANSRRSAVSSSGSERSVFHPAGMTSAGQGVKRRALRSGGPTSEMVTSAAGSAYVRRYEEARSRADATRCSQSRWWSLHARGQGRLLLQSVAAPASAGTPSAPGGLGGRRGERLRAARQGEREDGRGRHEPARGRVRGVPGRAGALHRAAAARWLDPVSARSPGARRGGPSRSACSSTR